MSEFLHKLAEGLRTREKLLEDHSECSAFDLPEGDRFKSEYNALLSEIKDFRERVDKARAAKKDFNEHFERQIEEDSQKLHVRVDTWQKNL